MNEKGRAAQLSENGICQLSGVCQQLIDYGRRLVIANQGIQARGGGTAIVIGNDLRDFRTAAVAAKRKPRQVINRLQMLFGGGLGSPGMYADHDAVIFSGINGVQIAVKGVCAGFGALRLRNAGQTWPARNGKQILPVGMGGISFRRKFVNGR